MKIFYLLLAAVLIFSCSPKIQPAVRDTVTVIKTETIEKLVRDTVTVTLPYDSVSVQTSDTTSTLKINAAISIAAVNRGMLFHSLYSNPNYKPEVEIIYKDRITYRDTTIYSNRVDIKEVEKVLNWWQKLMMSGGYILIGLIAGAIVILILKLKK